MDLLVVEIHRADAPGYYYTSLPVGQVPMALETTFDVVRTISEDGTRLVLTFPAYLGGFVEHELMVEKISIERIGFEAYDLRTNHDESSPQEQSYTSESADPYHDATVLAGLGSSMFITGEAGTGKSYKLWEIAADLQLNRNKKVVMTAMTGLAADELMRSIPDDVMERYVNASVDVPTVQTFHSAFGIRPTLIADLGKTSQEHITTKWADTLKPGRNGSISAYAKKILDNFNADVLMVDEISMLDAELFDAWGGVHHKLKNTPQIILSGDLAQLPPVGVEDPHPAATPGESEKRRARYIIDSDRWNTVVGSRVCQLNRNYRIDADPEWAHLLSRFRLNRQTEEDVEILKSMDSTRPGVMVTDDHVRLFPLNRMVLAYNEKRCNDLMARGAGHHRFKPVITKVIKIMGGDKQNITDKWEDHEHAKTMVERTIQEHGGPDGRELVVGAKVMLTVNLDVTERLVNGARGVIESIGQDGVVVEFERAGRKRIGWKTFEVSDRVTQRVGERSAMAQYTATVRIMPLELAFAMTIHKSQGTTLDKVYINLTESREGQTRACRVRHPGLVYVALSRARRRENVVIDGIDLYMAKRALLDSGVVEFLRHTFTPRVADDSAARLGLPNRNVDIYKEATLVSRTPLTVLFLRAELLERLRLKRQQQILEAEMTKQARLNRRLMIQQRDSSTPGSSSGSSIPF